ncbi:hypothetical protein EC968_002004 [Mortierella alpina]|nr:hypothetical protein EC968_002004 [Mortierella alpina]
MHAPVCPLIFASLIAFLSTTAAVYLPNYLRDGSVSPSKSSTTVSVSKGTGEVDKQTMPVPPAIRVLTANGQASHVHQNTPAYDDTHFLGYMGLDASTQNDKLSPPFNPRASRTDYRHAPQFLRDSVRGDGRQAPQISQKASSSDEGQVPQLIQETSGDVGRQEPEFDQKASDNEARHAPQFERYEASDDDGGQTYQLNHQKPSMPDDDRVSLPLPNQFIRRSHLLIPGARPQIPPVAPPSTRAFPEA